MNRTIIMIRSSPPPAAIPARAGVERPPMNDVTVVRIPPSLPVVTGDSASVNKLLISVSPDPDPLAALPLPKSIVRIGYGTEEGLKIYRPLHPKCGFLLQCACEHKIEIPKSSLWKLCPAGLC